MISILIFLSLTSSILNVEYNIEDGEAKELSKLSKGTEYSFSIRADEDQKLKIEMYMDYMDNKPFSKISIYEYALRYSFITRSNDYYVNPSTKNGKTYISKTYSVWYSTTSYVSINITPDYDIKNFKIKVTLSGLSTTAIVLLSTLIPFFCCVIICIVIVVVIRKSHRTKLVTQNQLIAPVQPTVVAQPLYTSPQPVYAPVQPQYIPPPQQQYNPQVPAPGLPY